MHSKDKELQEELQKKIEEKLEEELKEELQDFLNRVSFKSDIDFKKIKRFTKMRIKGKVRLSDGSHEDKYIDRIVTYDKVFYDIFGEDIIFFRFISDMEFFHIRNKKVMLIEGSAYLYDVEIEILD